MSEGMWERGHAGRKEHGKQKKGGDGKKGMDAKARQRLKKQEQEERHAARDEAKAAKQAAKQAGSEAKHVERQRLRAEKRRKVKEDREIRRQMRERRAVEQQDKMRQAEVTRVAERGRIDAKLSKAKGALRARLKEMARRSAEAMAFSRHEHVAFERSRSFAVSGMAGFGVTEESKLVSVSVEGTAAAYQAPNLEARLAEAGYSGKETELLAFTDVVQVGSKALSGLAKHAHGPDTAGARVHSVALCPLMGESGCVVVGSTDGVMLFSMKDDLFEPVRVKMTGQAASSGRARHAHALDGTHGCALMVVDSGSGLVVACMADGRLVLASCAIARHKEAGSGEGGEGGEGDEEEKEQEQDGERELEFACWYDTAGWLDPAVAEALVEFGKADSKERAASMVAEMRASGSRALTTPMKIWLNGSLLVAALRIELEGGSGYAVADVSMAAPGAGGTLVTRFVDSSLRAMTATGWQRTPVPPVVLTLPRRLEDGDPAASIKKHIAKAMAMLEESFDTEHSSSQPTGTAEAATEEGDGQPLQEEEQDQAQPEEPKPLFKFKPFRGRSGAAAAAGARAASEAFIAAHSDGVKAAESSDSAEGVASHGNSCTPQQVAACAGVAAALALDHSKELHERVAGARRRAQVVLATALGTGAARGEKTAGHLRPERQARTAGAAAARAYERTMARMGAESSTAAEAECAYTAALRVMEGYGMKVLEFPGHQEEDPPTDDEFMLVHAPSAPQRTVAAGTRRTSNATLPPIHETEKPGDYSRADDVGHISAELTPKFAEAALAGVAASMASLAKGGNQALPHRVAAAAARGAARVLEGAKGARPIDISQAAAEAAGASVANRRCNRQHRYRENTGPAAAGDAAFDAAVRYGMMGEKRLRNVAFAVAGKAAAASIIGVNEGTLPERAMRRSQAERGAGVIAQAAAAAGSAAAAACVKARDLVGESELLKGACNLKEAAATAGRAAGLAASQLGASMQASGKAAAAATLACGGCDTDAIVAAGSAAAAAGRSFNLSRSATIEAAASSAANQAEAAARKSGGSAVSRAAREAAGAALREGAKPKEEVLAAGAGAAICVLARACADTSLASPEDAWREAALAAGSAAAEAHATVRKRMNKRRQPHEEATAATLAAAIAVMRYYRKRPVGQDGHESDGGTDSDDDGEGLDVIQDTLIVLGGEECWRGLFFQPNGRPATGPRAAESGRGQIIWHERPTALGYSHPFVLTAYGGKGSLEVRNVFNGHVVQNISLPPGGADTLLASADLKLVYAATSSAVALLRRRSPLLRPAVLRRPWQDKQTMITQRKQNHMGIYILNPLPVGLPKPPEEIVLEKIAQQLREQEAAPTALQRQAQWLQEMKAQKAAEARAKEIASREKKLADRESAVAVWTGKDSIAAAAPGDSVARCRWKAAVAALDSLQEAGALQEEARQPEQFQHARNLIESTVPERSLRVLAEQMEALDTGGSAMSSETWATSQASDEVSLPRAQSASKHAESTSRYIVGVVCGGDVPRAANLLHKLQSPARVAGSSAALDRGHVSPKQPAPALAASSRPEASASTRSRLGKSKPVWRERSRDRRKEATRRTKLAEVGSPFSRLYLEATALATAPVEGAQPGNAVESRARSAAKAVRRLHARHGTGFLNRPKLRFDSLGARPREVRAALHIAAGSGSVEVVRALLDSGSALDIEDESGCSPLHWAAARPDSDGLAVAQLLLDRGARDDIENEMGKDPHAWAVRCGNSGVATLLAEHRQKLDAAAAAAAEEKARNPFYR